MSSPTLIELPGIVVPTTSGAFGNPVGVDLRGAPQARLVVDPAGVGDDDGAQLHLQVVYNRSTGGPLVVDLDAVTVQTALHVGDYEFGWRVPTLRLIPRLLGGSEAAAGKSFDVLLVLP